MQNCDHAQPAVQRLQGKRPQVVVLRAGEGRQGRRAAGEVSLHGRKQGVWLRRVQNIGGGAGGRAEGGEALRPRGVQMSGVRGL